MSFKKNLKSRGLVLERKETTVLQINVGNLCNLACKHCHVEAGPKRTGVMSRETMEDVVAFARRCSFAVADITGGAPELVPDIKFLLQELRPLVDRLMLRSNLVLLLEEEHRDLLRLCQDHKVVLVASFPSVNQGQTDAQRGKGVWEKSVAALKRLNEIGYGMPYTGLELDLVSNPSGAFLPVEQCTAEKKIRIDLARKWGISFSSLYTFANVPLGRFRQWLEQSGNLKGYLDKLAAGFNPATVEGLMCRSLISVSWDGILFDCDFNLAAKLPYSGNPVHVSAIDGPLIGTPIMTDDYCYACTAGAGFT